MSNAASSTAGPSRLTHPTGSTVAPSTSGDSESTAGQPAEKGLDVGVLKELARASLIEKLNDVGKDGVLLSSLVINHLTVRYKVKRR
jgi:hypothetical protein